MKIKFDRDCQTVTQNSENIFFEKIFSILLKKYILICFKKINIFKVTHSKWNYFF